jgi:hypothetical protein
VSSGRPKEAGIVIRTVHDLPPSGGECKGEDKEDKEKGAAPAMDPTP